MVKKFALTSTGPLSGKSTLARHLRDEYGFVLADHSLSVVRSFVEEWNAANDAPAIWPEFVYTHKERFRRDLQEHGYKVGFNDSEGGGNMFWIGRTLSEWLRDPSRPVVFEPARGEDQALGLRKLGFTLVQLNIPGDERCRRAEALGRDCGKIQQAMRTHPELEGGIASPDITLPSTLPVEVMGKILMQTPEDAHDLHIFGSHVH